MNRQHPFKKPAYKGDRLMWVPEISELANVQSQTVYKWFTDGTLPPVKLGGRRGCWESDFLAFAQPKVSGGVEDFSLPEEINSELM